jgi:hypothetical protein
MIKISFKEYEIIEKEKQITKIINGVEVAEIVIEKEYIVYRNISI